MGSGNLSEDLVHLSQGLSRVGVSMCEALELHLDCLARVFDGLGSQSLRHILSRANLLAVEMLLNMGHGNSPARPESPLGSFGIDLLNVESNA
jgi:hypothetical protein